MYNEPMYQIVQAPNEILRTPTKLVNPAMAGIQKIVFEMKQILLSQKDPEGVGLAANQIDLPYSLFITREEVFINPEIVDHSKELQPEDKKSPLEGCLSLPNYYGIVKRWKWIEIKYFELSRTYNLEPRTSRFEGFPAIVIQHEMDHLNGKIFVERILEQNGKLYKNTGEDKKGKDVWEEIEI